MSNDDIDRKPPKPSTVLLRVYALGAAAVASTAVLAILRAVGIIESIVPVMLPLWLLGLLLGAYFSYVVLRLGWATARLVYCRRVARIRRRRAESLRKQADALADRLANRLAAGQGAQGWRQRRRDLRR